MQPEDKIRYRKKPEIFSHAAFVLPVLFFPKAAISNNTKAGLLARFIFSGGLPIPFSGGTVAM